MGSATQRVMPVSTECMWQNIINEFWDKTNSPNYIGALDGKHIRLKKPPKSGSMYFNYKKHFSIVLLALADAKSKFICVDVGAYGSQGDSRIFRESAMGRRIHEGRFGIPAWRPLSNTTEPILPVVIVADEAFGLSENIIAIKKKIFNYRLSRAR